MRKVALSQWDEQHLSTKDKELLRNIQSQWNVDPSQNANLHTAAESIRSKYNYSGGVDGSQFVPTSGYGITPPKAPQIEKRQSKYQGDIDDIWKDLKNQPKFDAPYKQEVADLITEIGDRGEYDSKYNDRIDALINSFENRPAYESPYNDLMNETLSNILNKPAYSGGSAISAGVAGADALYKSFAERAGLASKADKAYKDTMGLNNAMTGGRDNTWASTSAIQAKGEVVDAEADKAYARAVQADQIAYGRYRDNVGDMYKNMGLLQSLDQTEYNRYRDSTGDDLTLIGLMQGQDDRLFNQFQVGTQNMYNFVNLLETRNQTEYNRFRDSVGDTKDLFNMVMNLDDREFRDYSFMADQQWKIFDAEYSEFKDTLTRRQDTIREAMNRTDMVGFVNNQDAITLGVPVGTPSQLSRERGEKMEDYITQTNIKLEADLKEMEKKREFDLITQKIKQASSSGKNGGSPSTPTTPTLSMADFGRRDAKVAEYNEMVQDKDFLALNPKQKYEKLTAWEEKEYTDASLGKLGDWGQDGAIVMKMIMEDVESTEEWERYVDSYEITAIANENFKQALLNRSASKRNDLNTGKKGVE